ncbi:hypothetical protein BH09BAC1_BH09BAC1_26990 [soil metagenome]
MRNFRYVNYAGNSYQIDYIIIDSVINLPCGLTWSTTKTDNKFLAGELGCLIFSGTSSDPVGQYNLRVKVKVKLTSLSSTAPYDLNDMGFFFAVRVCNNPSVNCPAINTSSSGVQSSCPRGQSTSGGSLQVELGNPYATVCSYNIINLAPTVSGGTPPYTYQWYATGGTVDCSTCPSTDVSIYTSGAEVYVQVRDANGNTANDMITYTLVSFNFQISPQYQTICSGENATFATIGNSGGTYIWSTGATTASITVSQDDDYSVTITSTNGCTATNAAHLSVLSKPITQPIIGPTSIVPLRSYSYLITDLGGIDFTWYAQNGAIQSGQYSNNVDVLWATNGPYALHVIQSASFGDCADTSHLAVDLGSSISIINTLQAKVYPNPTTGSFVVTMNNTAIAVNAELTDIMGRVVWQSTHSFTKQQEINLDGSEAGIYFLRLSTGQESGVYKIVKQ